MALNISVSGMDRTESLRDRDRRRGENNIHEFQVQSRKFHKPRVQLNLCKSERADQVLTLTHTHTHTHARTHTHTHTHIHTYTHTYIHTYTAVLMLARDHHSWTTLTFISDNLFVIATSQSVRIRLCSYKTSMLYMRKLKH